MQCNETNACITGASKPVTHNVIFAFFCKNGIRPFEVDWFSAPLSSLHGSLGPGTKLKQWPVSIFKNHFQSTTNYVVKPRYSILNFKSPWNITHNSSVIVASLFTIKSRTNFGRLIIYIFLWTKIYFTIVKQARVFLDGDQVCFGALNSRRACAPTTVNVQSEILFTFCVVITSILLSNSSLIISLQCHRKDSFWDLKTVHDNESRISIRMGITVMEFVGRFVPELVETGKKYITKVEHHPSVAPFTNMV